METNTSARSIIKRLNLLIVLIAVLGSISAGYITAREYHSSAIYSASQPTWDETVPVQKHEPGEKYVKPEFISDADMVKIEEAKAIRVSDVSWLMPSIKGAGVAMVIFISFLILMSTISWLLGYGFKIHISTR